MIAPTLLSTLQEYADPVFFPAIPRLSTGCRQLDLALKGGWARGRVSEIYGDPASGKTLLCLKTVRQAIQEGAVAFFDADGTLDTVSLQNTPNLSQFVLLSRQMDGQDVEDIAVRLIGTGAFALVVVDSLSAVPFGADDLGDYFSRARRITDLVVRLNTALRYRDTVVLLVSHLKVNMRWREAPDGGAAKGKWMASRVQTGAGMKARVVKNAEGVASYRWEVLDE